MTSPDNAPIPAGATGQPVGAWGDDSSFGATTDALASAFPNFIGFFIALALKALGDLVGGIPFVGDGLEDILDGIADHLIGVRQTATTAQSSADVAYTNAGVAYTTAQNAQTTANSVSATATAAAEAAAAAQAAASDAANAAAAAADTADAAVEAAQYWKDEFVVSSAGVLLGKNEMVLGVVMDVPPGKARRVTRIHYAMLSNSSTMTIQLIKVNAAGTTETVILTTNITSGATRQTDSTIDVAVADKERILCNVTAIGGTASGLQCAVVGTFI